MNSIPENKEGAPNGLGCILFDVGWIQVWFGGYVGHGWGMYIIMYIINT